jgi:hypothetical protein
LIGYEEIMAFRFFALNESASATNTNVAYPAHADQVQGAWEKHSCPLIHDPDRKKL